MVNLSNPKHLTVYDDMIKIMYYVVRQIDTEPIAGTNMVRAKCGFEVYRVAVGKNHTPTHNVWLFTVYPDGSREEIQTEMRMCAGMLSQMVEGKSEHNEDSIRAYYLL